MHILKVILILVFIIALLFTGTLLSDKYVLRKQILRMHVIAASNSSEDQGTKLRVRDAVLDYLQNIIGDKRDISAVREFISQEIDTLQAVANCALMEAGSKDVAQVTLTLEEFSKREYDTFSLPSGVYESLQIRIGAGEGKNWWCVVFPALCTPDTTDTFCSTAVSSGFNEGLADTLANDREYEIRFFILDCLGKIENFLIFS